MAKWVVITTIVSVSVLWALSLSATGLPNPAALEMRAYSLFPKEMLAIAKKGIPRNSDGLIGRNAEWGKLYSPRFQMGAGRALRIALSAGRIQQAKKAFLAVKTGSSGIHDNGYVRSRLPKHVTRGRSLTRSDIASAAAFYLSDACAGLLALENSTYVNEVAKIRERARLIDAMRRALNWLMSQRHTLMQADTEAPNRLFIDALAYQACGRLTLNEAAVEAAQGFIQRALSQQHTNGYFVEKKGWDTGYQAVAIRIANDLVYTGPANEFRLRKHLLRAAQWLAGRVDANGRVDSSGNTRTCEGGETFLGRPKKPATEEIFLALIYVGMREKNRALVQSGARIAHWYRQNPGSDTC